MSKYFILPLGGGEGGGGTKGEKVVELTQAEYDALAVKEANTTYIITDAPSIDLSDFATNDDVDELRESVDGKADKQSVTANSQSSYYTSKKRFPTWNSDGVITGVEDYNAGFGFTQINGSYQVMLTLNASSFQIYAPTTAGTKDQVLLSNGSGAPVWANQNSITGGISFWKGTQAQYDAIATKDNSTLYIITD